MRKVHALPKRDHIIIGGGGGGAQYVCSVCMCAHVQVGYRSVLRVFLCLFQPYFTRLCLPLNGELTRLD